MVQSIRLGAQTLTTQFLVLLVCVTRFLTGVCVRVCVCVCCFLVSFVWGLFHVCSQPWSSSCFRLWIIEKLIKLSSEQISFNGKVTFSRFWLFLALRRLKLVKVSFDGVAESLAGYGPYILSRRRNRCTQSAAFSWGHSNANIHSPSCLYMCAHACM